MLVLILKRFKCLGGVIQLVRGELQLVLTHGDIAPQAVGIVKPELYVRFLFYLGVFDISLCLDALAFKRTEPRTYFVKYVLRALHVIARGGKPAFRLVLFVAVFGDACGILEYAAPLVAFARHYIRDPALTYYRIAVASDAGVEEHLINVAQTDLLAVYEIFAVAVAVVTARNGYLVVWAVYFSRRTGVVKCDRHLGIAHRLAAVRTAEDDVLHLGTAQAL